MCSVGAARRFQKLASNVRHAKCFEIKLLFGYSAAVLLECFSLFGIQRKPEVPSDTMVPPHDETCRV